MSPQTQNESVTDDHFEGIDRAARHAARIARSEQDTKMSQPEGPLFMGEQKFIDQNENPVSQRVSSRAANVAQEKVELFRAGVEAEQRRQRMEMDDQLSKAVAAHADLAAFTFNIIDDRTPESWDASARGLLGQSMSALYARAQHYDAPGGERSMAATVAAFNAIYGLGMTEVQGWQFMELLKIVRSSQGKFKPDNFVDGAAYAALAGEAAARG